MPQQIQEPEKSLPVAGEFDVIICGGGPAGIAAALASARKGARTLLVEARGCLGGIWTAGLLPWVLDAGNKHGVMRELVEAIDREKLRTVYETEMWGVHFDPEMMKRLLERLCLDAGVTLRLHTLVVAGFVDDQRRLSHLITESKSGREAWGAKVFVDCTGEGDLAARCGCSFAMGEPETGKTQPFSMLALLAGPRLDEVQPYLAGWANPENPNRLDHQRHGPAIEKLYAELAESGLEISYARPLMVPIHDGLYMLMANHEYGVSAVDADDITRATCQSRAEVEAIVKTLRERGGPWRNLRLVGTSEHIGLREGRRIKGLYEVTVDDLLQGARHKDAICRVTMRIDVHSTDASQSKSHDPRHRELAGKSQPYDIPLRALISAEIDGLMMAGRCISGDFLAHSSYRVTGNAVAMGEAAGTAAAFAARHDIAPRHLPFADVAAQIGGLQAE